jgi:LAO/AO transport system kinase
VLTAVARDGTGVADLVAAIEAHQDHVSRTGRLEQARRERLLRHTRDVVDRALSALVWEERNGGATVERALEELASGRLSPYRLAHDIVADLGKGARHER